MSTEMNTQLVMIVGESASGKSASLRNLANQEKWLYLNTEAGKRPPFKNKFMNGGFNIDEPGQVYEAFDHARDNPDVIGVIVDSLTFLLDMVETQVVLTAGEKYRQKAWGDFAQYLKVLMQEKVTRLQKPAIFTAHTLRTLNEEKGEWMVSIPVKGSLKNNGVEAYFSTIVAAKKLKLAELEKYPNKLLHISEEERELGYKHVFQTRITKETVGERIRSPMGMFTKDQTYIDNDAQLLLNHLNEYYGVK